jgi:hypothetical protein
MEEKINPIAHRILFLNTLAFTICFAVWTFNGVMVTYLVDNNVFQWGAVEIGWLLGIPILTGSVLRLPMGILTDRYGGKRVFVGLLLCCAIPMYLMAFATSFAQFALLSFGFGMAGAAFAVGIAFTSVWYQKHCQGRALGIFGAGNAGAALTTLFAPTLLNQLTRNGENLENWRENAYEANITLKMPKFKMQYKMDNMKDDLIEMGLETPFHPNPKNFTKLFDHPTEPMYISRVVHDALIEVDEKGTEAAAATSVEVGIVSVNPNTPFTLTLDRPFIFFIQENHSGAILFMGKLGNPQLLN